MMAIFFLVVFDCVWYLLVGHERWKRGFLYNNSVSKVANTDGIVLGGSGDTNKCALSDEMNEVDINSLLSLFNDTIKKMKESD